MYTVSSLRLVLALDAVFSPALTHSDPSVPSNLDCQPCRTSGYPYSPGVRRCARFCPLSLHVLCRMCQESVCNLSFVWPVRLRFRGNSSELL
ncbi:hypothetical protein F5883DRAFT_556639, partial [Diaporthe sp. PMI_573]